MRRIASSLAAIILTCAAAVPASAQQNCHLGQVASIDLSLDSVGRPSVPVTLNGMTVHFTVDTGALVSIVNSAIVDELKLDRRRMPLELMLLGGVKTTEGAMVNKLAVGSMHGEDIEMAVMPQFAFQEFGFDGLLGPDILSHYDIDFDFAHAKFNVFSPDHCPGAVVYWTKGGYAKVPFQIVDALHISVPVVLDGKTVTAIIDTGAESSVMSLSTASSTFGIDPSNPAMHSRGEFSINGTEKRSIYYYPFNTLSLEGVTISHPVIDIAPDVKMGKAQLILGAATLRQLHLYIAYSEKTLYLTPAEAQ